MSIFFGGFAIGVAIAAVTLMSPRCLRWHVGILSVTLLVLAVVIRGG